MANKKEIGAYSAYAIAVKYGFEGTEREWVEANDIAREAAAKSSETAASSSASAAKSCNSYCMNSSVDIPKIAIRKDGVSNLRMKALYSKQSHETIR